DNLNGGSNGVHWNTICSFSTAFHVDTIEFSPDHRVALCGSYELDEESRRRVGQLLVFTQTDESHFYLSLQLDCAGLLDLSWLDNVTAVGAQANGEAVLWHLDENDRTNCAPTYRRITDALLLSTQVTREKYVPHSALFLVRLLNFLFGLCRIRTPVDCDTLQENVYYSGGDDGVCYAWDERCYSKPTLSLKHEVGVCSVVAQPIGTNTISTGW
ncbi:hypothetical protein FGIG_11981, partial [Fasciola gigantica]